MKVWIFILLMLFFPGACAIAAEPQEEIVIFDLQDVQAGEAADGEGAYWVRFDAAFRLFIPEGWKHYALSEAQIENNMIACFGDGAHYMFLSREPGEGMYADMNKFSEALSENGAYDAIFAAQFGGADFLCYSDYASESANCATFTADAVYTFYFYPTDGDEAFAQTMLDIMGSFAAEDEEVSNG